MEKKTLKHITLEIEKKFQKAWTMKRACWLGSYSNSPLFFLPHI